MAKRPMIDVDETYLQQIIAGNVPMGIAPSESNQREPAEKKEVPADEKPNDHAVEPEKDEQTQDTKKPRKRKSHDYTERFLKKNTIKNRKGVYVSEEVYDKIDRYLPIVGKGVSIVGYIDNIIREHLNEYTNEINELYENNICKPL